MERLDRDAPVYALAQPDGNSVTLDLSIRDTLGDFSVEMRFPDGRQVGGSVYHSGEPRLFVAVLRCWADAATPREIATGIDWVRHELAATTKNLEATTKSENSFDHDLRAIAAIGEGVDIVEESRHRSEGASSIILTPDPSGVTLTLGNSDLSPTSCRVEANDLPALVAGMIWRSFKKRSTPNSRLSTATYLEALDTFDQAVRRRAGA